MSRQRRCTNDDNLHEERIKNDAFIAPFGAVGYKFRKHFEGYGWFDGEVVEIRPGAGELTYLLRPRDSYTVSHSLTIFATT